MRILMLGAAYIIAARRPLDWMCQLGHQVWLMGTYDPYQAQTIPNYTFVDFPAEHAKQQSDHDNLPKTDPAIYEQGVEQLRALIERERIEVIHAHFGNFGAYCCALGGLKPLVISIWGDFNDLLVDPSVGLPRKMRKILSEATGLIVESPALQQLAYTLDVCPPLVPVIPLGANTERFRPPDPAKRARDRRALGLPADTVVLLSARGLSSFYNHELILAAYIEALPHFTQPTLLAYGQLNRSAFDQEGQTIRAAIQQRAAEAGIAHTICWLPELRYELMPTLFGVADLVVNYPSNDAFPSTLIEATACERPVLTARLPSYQGTFIDEFCYQVEANQPAALAAGMIAMVNGLPGAWPERMHRARQVIIAEYEEQIAQQRMVALYQAAIDHQLAQRPGTPVTDEVADVLPHL